MARLLRWLGIALLALVLVVVAGLAVLYGAVRSNARDAGPPRAGEATPVRRAVATPDAPEAPKGAAAPQILFGDLHVHSDFSWDAMIQGLRFRDRESAHPPADACDFARFCSGLDFWSINDHAETLTPAHWSETVRSIRQCNDIAGDPASPDLVSFLGWEWSQNGLTPATHFGHKNVVLRGTADADIPARPIASANFALLPFGAIGVVASLTDPRNDSWGDWAGYHRYLVDLVATPECPTGVPVRELPDDCLEIAATPEGLYEKLADWGHDALVIPHGLAWGITNPAGADLALQLKRHDPRWQRLIEVYSGHGNSEVFADFARPVEDADGRLTCPETGDAVELCCQRAPALARARCDDPESAACEEQVAEAVQLAARADRGFFSPVPAVPGTTLADWGDCGELRESFLPAHQYRPRQSAQYALALGAAGGEAVPQRLDFGFIASSDNHRSRPGTGYKEFGRLAMTDGIGYFDFEFDAMDERATSFYYTGGLVAVHAAGRDRDAIYDALHARHVYGTSGPRILLWFDRIAPDGSRQPMGSEVAAEGPVRFEVRAIGAREQLPGCPAETLGALSPARLASLCRGECHHPGDGRLRIERIEVVRIRPQQRADQPIAERIDDPWRVFQCPTGEAGCAVSFEDPEPGPESVYYVRALQQPTEAVNGDPLRCERTDDGGCRRSRPCGFLQDGTPDDCLAPVRERAWSSPIFVRAKKPANLVRRGEVAESG